MTIHPIRTGASSEPATTTTDGGRRRLLGLRHPGRRTLAFDPARRHAIRSRRTFGKRPPG